MLHNKYISILAKKLSYEEKNDVCRFSSIDFRSS